MNGKEKNHLLSLPDVYDVIRKVWLYNNTISSTTMTHSNYDSYSTVEAIGGEGLSSVYTSYSIAPVLSLSSNVKISGGTGTSTDPYTFSLQ